MGYFHNFLGKSGEAVLGALTDYRTTSMTLLFCLGKSSEAVFGTLTDYQTTSIAFSENPTTPFQVHQRTISDDLTTEDFHS